MLYSLWQNTGQERDWKKLALLFAQATVMDEEENACNTPEQQQQRWRSHFTKLLNIQSKFDEKLQKARQRPLRPNMSALPLEEEIWESIGKLKSGKAGGDSGILPEMVKSASCEEGFFHLLMDPVHATWCECRVPKEWSDAVLVPKPKKGDLGKCDNWREISLLDVVEKAVARILQEQLQKLAEDVLPKLQCGLGRPEDVLT